MTLLSYSYRRYRRSWKVKLPRTRLLCATELRNGVTPPLVGILDFCLQKGLEVSGQDVKGGGSAAERGPHFHPVAAEVSTHATTKPAGSMAAQFETLLLSTEDNITTICLNRPQKKNAISVMMYSEIIEALRLAGKDESIITVITGSGDYYCSGNDLTNFVTTKVTRSRVEQTDEEFLSMFRDFVRAFIDFPKPLIAVVNGPAVGVAVTLLGLFDTVYATDRATFHTPFTKLGMFPEGCSSYTFPRMMGAAKASEMLLFGRKLSAAEAREQGLVTDVFPDSTFQAEVWRRLKAYAQLPRNSLVLSKQLMRSHYREKLHAVNDRECEVVAGLQQSEECMNAVVSFLQSKSKL